MSRPAGRWWPHLRAAMLCTVVLGNLVQAVPFPRQPVEDEDRATWREADLDLWFGWLQATGWFASRSDFQEQTVDAYLALKDAGDWIQAPVRPFFRAIRTTQQWGLFAVVAEQPERLVVDIDVDGSWQRISARLDSEYPWEDERFRYRRVRGTWDTVKEDKPNPLYDAFCRWAARRALTDHPQASRVRIRRERFVVSAPWETLDPTITPVHERTFTRGETTLWALR